MHLIEYEYKEPRGNGNYKSWSVAEPIKNYLLANDSSKIFRIKAENSHGKSFFLNTVASSLIWNVDRPIGKINSELKNKLKDFHRLTDGQLSYNIRLKVKEGVLIVNKDSSGNRTTFIESPEGEKRPLTDTEFENKYSLIYDIPSDPTERVFKILENVQNKNNHYKSSVKSLVSSLSLVADRHIDVKNQNTIDSLKEKCKNLKYSIEKNEENIKSLSHDLKTVERFNKIEDLFRKKNSLKDEVVKFNKLKSQLKTLPELSGSGVPVDGLTSRLSDLGNSMSMLALPARLEFLCNLQMASENGKNIDLMSNMNTQKFTDELRNLSQKIRNEDELSQVEIARLKKLVSPQSDLKMELLNAIENIKSNKVELIDEFQVVRAFRDFVSRYQNSEVLASLFRNRLRLQISPGAVIEELTKYLEEYQFVQDLEEFEEVIDNDFNDVYGKTKEYFKILKEIREVEERIKQLDSDSQVERELIERRVNSAKRNIDQLNKEIDNMISVLVQLGVSNTDCNEILKRKSEVLRKFKPASTKKLDKLNEELSRLRTIKSSLKQEIDKEEKKLAIESAKSEPDLSKYQIAKLNHVKKAAMYLVKFIDNCSGKINVENKQVRESSNLSNSINNKYELLIGELAAEFLGKKLLHVKDEFDIKRIDFVNRKFIATTGDEILFSSFGSGQGGAIYLKTLIDSSVDKQHIILLDEVGLMSNNAVDQFMENIKELDKKDNLVMAVLVSAKEQGEMEVYSYD